MHVAVVVGLPGIDAADDRLSRCALSLAQGGERVQRWLQDVRVQEVREGGATWERALVLRDEVQVGLGRVIHHPDLELRPFHKEELVLVCAPEHAFTKRKQRPADPDALARRGPLAGDHQGKRGKDGKP